MKKRTIMVPLGEGPSIEFNVPVPETVEEFEKIRGRPPTKVEAQDLSRNQDMRIQDTLDDLEGR